MESSSSLATRGCFLDGAPYAGCLEQLALFAGGLTALFLGFWRGRRIFQKAVISNMTFLVSLPPSSPHTHTTHYEGLFHVVVYTTIWYSVATYIGGAHGEWLKLFLLCL